MQKRILIEKALAVWLPIFSKIKSPQSEYLENELTFNVPTPSQLGGGGRDIVGEGVEVEMGVGKEEEEVEVEEKEVEEVEVGEEVEGEGEGEEVDEEEEVD